MVQDAKDIVQEIRNSYQKALLSSTWLSDDFRLAALKKMENMVSYVGSPGRRLEPDYVEALYKPYPDAPLDLLFPTWIKALGLSSHYMWTDTTTPLYDETRYSPIYMENQNDFTLPTISLFRPFMYPYGITALNYGGVGMMIAHEITHAFDVRGIHSLEGYVPDDMDDVIKEYTKRALCLRTSHKSVLSLSGQEGTLNDDLDSENLADLAGTKVAYDAFASLDSGSQGPNSCRAGNVSEAAVLLQQLREILLGRQPQRHTLRTKTVALHSAANEHAGFLQCIWLRCRDCHESTGQVHFLVAKKIPLHLL
ncbi:hypothetical protein MTO96_008174 [Rhipicephalus appendiculatus]